MEILETLSLYFSRIGELIPISSAQSMLLLLIFGSVFLAVFGTAMLLGSFGGLDRRLSIGTSRVSKGRQGGTAGGAGSSQISRVFARFSHSVIPNNEDLRSRVRQRLVQAGYLTPSVVGRYYAWRIIMAVCLPLAFVLIAPVVSSQMEAETILMFAFMLAALGFFVPVFVVSRRIARRQLAIREAFPDALDMLMVCVEAGLGLDAAINRVSREILAAHPMLGEQLELTAIELRVGKSREEALRNLSDRIGIDEITSLVTLLVQSSNLGASISQALRVHADELRAKRMLRAEEKAHKLPVKLSVPLVFLILPMLIIVIVGPSVIEITKDLMPAFNNSNMDVLDFRR